MHMLQDTSLRVACRVRESNILSYAQPTTLIDPAALRTPGGGSTPKTLAGLLGVPAGTPMPKRPWQLLAPGEPFDPASAPEGTTVRDQVSRSTEIEAVGLVSSRC